MLKNREKESLDNLVGMALLYDDFQEQLLNRPDDTWLKKHGLSEPMRGWLRTVEADSLAELAQAILSEA